MCFSRADSTVSDMLKVRFVDSDVGAAVREIEVDGFGLSSSMRSENLFEEDCVACDDCGNNVDASVRPEGGTVFHIVSWIEVG